MPSAAQAKRGTPSTDESVLADLRAGMTVSVAAATHHRSRDTVRKLALINGLDTGRPYRPWSIQDDARLLELSEADPDLDNLAAGLDRPRSSVKSRLHFLGGPEPKPPASRQCSPRVPRIALKGAAEILAPAKEKHTFEPEVQTLINVWWGGTGKPGAEAIASFAKNLRHMQIDLLNHYYPRMDEPTKDRAVAVILNLTAQADGQPHPIRLCASRTTP